MKNRIWMLCAAVALVAGCSSVSEKQTAATPPPPPPKLAPVAGTQLDQRNTQQVRHSESLKAYPVNRYVDPNDPNVMHEGHVVYRREVSGGWNLNPNAPTVVPLGPALAVADGAKHPNPLPAELEQRIVEQNQLMASLIEQNESLSKELARLNREIGEMRQRGSFAAAEEKR
jgi:hypothetical protein